MKKAVVLAGIIGLAVIIGGAFYFNSTLAPVDKDNDKQIIVEISKGSTLDDVAEILIEKNLIQNQLTFYWYGRFQDGQTIKAGKYALTKSMSADAILTHLFIGKVYQNLITVTIPEGFRIIDIAQTLSELGLINKQKFYDVINNGDFSEIDIMKHIPNKTEDRKYRLEGFLFPKTYQFTKDVTEEEIVETMLRQTQEEIKSKWLQDIKGKGLSLYKVMILASIVEREAVVDKERPIIAEVYYNRIEMGMPLQADATIQYLFEDPKSRLLYEDLERESPYNTYLHKGLPPSPIGSPSSKSIKAAIYPDENNYKFYVTKKDGSWEHYFAVTYEQHLANIEKSEQ